MKVKELVEQLSKMNPEVDVYLAIYTPDDSGDQDHYLAQVAIEYDDSRYRNENHVQIKGGP